MNLKRLLTAVSILGFAFGIGFLVFPFDVIALYGIRLTQELEYIPRYLGSAFLALAVVNWFAKELPEAGELRVILLGDLVLAISGLCVALLNAVYRPGNGLVWSTVAIYGLMTLGFAYFQFGKHLPTSGHGTPLPH